MITEGTAPGHPLDPADRLAAATGPEWYPADAMTTRKSPHKRVYKVIFLNQGQVYEVFAKSVSQGSLFGFVEIEQLLFGERTQMVVDPSEERLKTEFAGVSRFYVPMHAVVRIDEVEKEGPARITQSSQKDGNLSTFPAPIYTPGEKPGKS
jgi:hypothetical protein